MGQRRERKNMRKENQLASREANAPRKAKERIRTAKRREELQKKLDAVGY